MRWHASELQCLNARFAGIPAENLHISSHASTGTCCPELRFAENLGSRTAGFSPLKMLANILMNSEATATPKNAATPRAPKAGKCTMKATTEAPTPASVLTDPVMCDIATAASTFLNKKADILHLESVQNRSREAAALAEGKVVELSLNIQRSYTCFLHTWTTKAETFLWNPGPH